MRTTKRMFLVMVGLSASIAVNAQVPWELSAGTSGYVTTHTTGNCDVDGNLNLGINLYMKGWILNMNRPGDDLIRSIQAQSPKQGIQLCANTNTSDGSSIQLNGAGGQNPGLLSYCSYGTSGGGHNFLNYDYAAGTGWHANMTISNAGHVTVGHDLWPSSVLPGDVLAIQDQLGFYSTTPRIHGNTDNSAFVINANGSTGGWDGPTVEMYGPHASSSPGEIRSFSYTTPGSNDYYGHMFLNYNPSIPAPNDFHANMSINKDGTVVIGNELIYSYNTTHPAPANNYLLYVEKGILTERLKVANSADPINWSDFVFNDDYKLRSLSDVESYISVINTCRRYHLPKKWLRMALT